MKVDSKALFISIDGASMRGLIYLLWFCSTCANAFSTERVRWCLTFRRLHVESWSLVNCCKRMLLYMTSGVWLGRMPERGLYVHVFYETCRQNWRHRWWLQGSYLSMSLVARSRCMVDGCEGHICSCRLRDLSPKLDTSRWLRGV
jgi:hypothetical protein